MGPNEHISAIKFGRFSHIQIAQKISKIKKNFFDEKLISKSWAMKIFSEKFSRWKILENFQLKSNFSRFFDFRKFPIDIQLFSKNIFITLHFSSYHFLLETNFWIRFFVKFQSTERGSIYNALFAGIFASIAGIFFQH